MGGVTIRGSEAEEQSDDDDLCRELPGVENPQCAPKDRYSACAQATTQVVRPRHRPAGLAWVAWLAKWFDNRLCRLGYHYQGIGISVEFVCREYKKGFLGFLCYM